MKEVIFANLSAYKYGTLLPVEEAYGTVNYGVGSSTNLGNPYGVEEVGTRVNYFEVGSGLPTYTNGTRLWNLGYRLTLNSQYGGISSRDTYAAYSTQIISAPQIMNVSNGARALFTGWTGSGFGSYTGPKNNTQLMLTANVTETANWQLQYFVNVASSYGITSGSGWYNSSSTASYSISNTSFSRGAQEFRFFDWSNGNNATGGDVQVNAPFSISALWQYKANFIPEDAYGREISASYLLVDGVKTNSTPFLDTGKVSRVTGVYYKNMLLPTSVNMSEGSPPLESIPLPVYNISVKTLGLLEIIPVNASALIKFRNGTVLSTYMGPRGVLNITDVPEGYANVTLRYLGMEQNVLIQGGGGKTVLFLTFVNMLGLLLLIYFGSYLLHRHRVKRLAAAEKQG
jgi:uncharacterized repeat protein (TIGR02543 family)